MLPLKVVNTTVKIGLEKPFKLFHITDSHLCRAYDNEDEKTVFLAERRDTEFTREKEGAPRVPGQSEYLLNEAVKYGKSIGATFVFTGDIVDYISRSNYEYFKAILDQTDYIYAAGNHDFASAELLYNVINGIPNSVREDETYKRAAIPSIMPYIKKNLFFESRVINGVNLITLDNSYNYILAEQLELLRAEAAKGLPILLFMHNPLFTPELAHSIMAGRPWDPCPYCAAIPDSFLPEISERHRESMKSDSITLEAAEFIKSEPLFKGVFVGHLHKNYENALSDNLTQYVTGGTFWGHAREITVV